MNAGKRVAYEAAMTENTLLKAVLDDLKAEGCVPATASRPVRDCARRQPAPDPHTRVPWDLEEPLRVPPGEAPIVHSDRGGHYRWPERIAICEAAGLTRSMSRKGRSCDNARAEGFFGLLGREFFHDRDWIGVGRVSSRRSSTSGCGGSARGASRRRSAGSRPTSTGLP